MFYQSECLISFDPNGGDGKMSDQIINGGIFSKLKKNEFSKDGYFFAGWSTALDGSVEFRDEEHTDSIYSDSKLYAVWGIIPLSSFTFKDDNFETAVLDSGYSYLHELQNLQAVNKNIIYIDGIEELTALTELDLQNNQISDIKPLENLTKLTTLWLSNNNILDIEPLRQLEKLQYLELIGNKNLTDIEPLRELTSLVILWLNDNNISNIESLKMLKNLRYLELIGNNISNEDKNSLKLALPNCTIVYE